MQAIKTRENDMPSTHAGAPGKNRKRFALAVLATALLASATVVVWRQQAVPLSSNESAEPASAPGSAASGPANTVDAEQTAAVNALAQQVGSPPLSGPVTQRPDFVSPLEWQVLQGVAREHAQPERELTRLVNSLRFNKELELWRSGSMPAGSAQAMALEKQLLQEIPARVAEQEMGLAEAQQLQQALLKDLVPDSEARHRRAEEEAGRLGVTFSIQETGEPARKESPAGY